MSEIEICEMEGCTEQQSRQRKLCLLYEDGNRTSICLGCYEKVIAENPDVEVERTLRLVN